MISQDDQWKRCKYADAQQHRSRVSVSDSIKLKEWFDFLKGA